jgi:leucyl/phenylalanyl-tRNA---protein transferase
VPVGSELTAETLLRAYAMGIFPMAESRNDPRIHWVDPRFRGIFPLDNFHISRSLSREISKGNFTIRTNYDFLSVVDSCADRPDTWINDQIRSLYLTLHKMGFAHSMEVWKDERLAGGVYGVAIGAAFFGESMFSRVPNGSKIALAYLMHRLRAGGYTLFDTQFITPHLHSLGAIEISREQYQQHLRTALEHRGTFDPPGYSVGASGVLQRNIHTS